MATLKDLLDEIDVKLDDEEESTEEDNFDINKIPEDQQKHYNKLTSEIEDFKNKVAEQDLVIKTLKDAFNKATPKKEEIEEPEDEDDELLKEVKTLRSEIAALKDSKAIDTEKQFETNMIAFARENPDVARYAETMDNLIDEYPKLKEDIPKLYKFAKSISSGKQKPKRKTGEGGGGLPLKNVTNITEAKSIKDAFNLAENKLNRGGK